MKKTALLLMLTSLSAMAMSDNEAAGTLMAMGGMILAFFAVMLVVQIFFILSVNETIRAVKTEQSGASEVMAWLMLIPIVGYVFAIITVVKLAADYKYYVQKHQLSDLYNNDGGQLKGLIAFIASLCGVIPGIGFIAAIVGFVFFVLYWIELGNLRTSIAAVPAQVNA